MHVVGVVQADRAARGRGGSAGRERKRRWSKRQLEQNVSRVPAAAAGTIASGGRKEDEAERQEQTVAAPVFAKLSFELQVADVEDGDSVRVMGTPLGAPAAATLLLIPPPAASSAPPAGEDQLPMLDLQRDASRVCV